MLLALDRVVKMGSSSGSDVALGVLSAFQFQMRRPGGAPSAPSVAQQVAAELG